MCVCVFLTEQRSGLREQLSVAAVEDASQILSQLQMLDLVLSDGNVSGSARIDTFASAQEAERRLLREEEEANGGRSSLVEEDISSLQDRICVETNTALAFLIALQLHGETRNVSIASELSEKR